MTDILLCISDEPAGHRRAALLRPAKRLAAALHAVIFNGRRPALQYRVSTSVGVVIYSNEKKKMQAHNALCHSLRPRDRRRILKKKKRKRKGGRGKTISGHFSEINLISLLFGGPL